MNFEMMTDKEVVIAMGQQYDVLRRRKQIQDKEVLASSGSSSSVLAKFRGGKGNITIETFVKFMRAIGELDKLESLMSVPDSYSPAEHRKYLLKSNSPAKRIHKPKGKPHDFVWGDEKNKK